MGWDGMGWAVNRKICTASGIDISVIGLAFYFAFNLVLFKRRHQGSTDTITFRIQFDFEYKGPRR